MILNALKNKTELMKEILKDYLKQSAQLLRREEICRKEWQTEKTNDNIIKLSWSLNEDSMELNAAEDKKRKNTHKCFKCGKVKHI